jgi:hypothetical protein
VILRQRDTENEIHIATTAMIAATMAATSLGWARSDIG